MGAQLIIELAPVCQKLGMSQVSLLDSKLGMCWLLSARDMQAHIYTLQTSLTGSFNAFQHTPLYKNEQNERVIFQWRLLWLTLSFESFSKNEHQISAEVNVAQQKSDFSCHQSNMINVEAQCNLWKNVAQKKIWCVVFAPATEIFYMSH